MQSSNNEIMIATNHIPHIVRLRSFKMDSYLYNLSLYVNLTLHTLHTASKHYIPIKQANETKLNNFQYTNTLRINQISIHANV